MSRSLKVAAVAILAGLVLAGVANAQPAPSGPPGYWDRPRYVPGPEVQFGWTRSTGPVAGYEVTALRWVAGDGRVEPFTETYETDECSQLVIPAAPGDRIRVYAVAFETDGTQGPASELSSEVIVIPEPGRLLQLGCGIALLAVLVRLRAWSARPYTPEERRRRMHAV